MTILPKALADPYSSNQNPSDIFGKNRKILHKIHMAPLRALKRIKLGWKLKR
jgi:hypothetical protein